MIKDTLTPKPSDLLKMDIEEREKFIQKQLEIYSEYDFIEDEQDYIDYK